MTDDTRARVLVVGAGPTGLMLAASLLRRGIAVRIVDRADRANPHSKAVILWPRALEAFQSIGVGQEMFERGVKFVASTYYTGPRLIGRLKMRPLKGTRFPLAVSLPQSTTESILRAEVERLGGRIEFARHLTSLHQDEHGVDAVFEDGPRERADWVVGCDGGHSTVREQIGVRFDGTTYPQTFMLVDGHFDTDYAHDESYYVMHPTGVIVILGLPDGHYRAFASVPPGADPEHPEKEVMRIVAANSPRRLDLVTATGSGTFQVHRKMADRMRSGRVLIAGDAAHIHSPAGGVGLNTGVQDAHSLAWRLAGVVRGSLTSSDLDEWEAERLFVAAGVIAETDRQTRMWMLTGVRRLLRDVLISVGLRTTIMERVLPQRLAQLNLVVPAPGKRLKRLRPGARIRDIELTPGHWLHDGFDQGGHLVLGFGAGGAELLASLTEDAAPNRAVASCLAITERAGAVAPSGVETHDDRGGRIRRALGAPRDGVCVVRPDAVILAACPTSDVAEVARLRRYYARLHDGHALEGALA
jgi:2-polyprenyl-6-methoxyphenol hydroxylase-like FAD-dependent oxidoreductase